MTNLDDIHVRLASSMQKEAEERRKNRIELLSKLADAGVTQLTAIYNGYGDEGNVHEVMAEPSHDALPGDLLPKVSDFAWDMAYALHPGFENNEGGNGEFVWNITTDTINITHNDCYVEHDTTVHEDV